MSVNLQQFIDSLQSNNANSMRFCLEAGCPFAQTKAMKNTVLHHGAMQGAMNGSVSVALMIQAGGEEDVNAKDFLGMTPLHVAANFGCIDVAADLALRCGEFQFALIDHGVDLEPRKNDGETPLFLAAKNSKNDAALGLSSLGPVFNRSTVQS